MEKGASRNGGYEKIVGSNKYGHHALYLSTKISTI